MFFGQCLSILFLKVFSEGLVMIFSGREFQSSIILELNECFLSSVNHSDVMTCTQMQFK